MPLHSTGQRSERRHHFQQWCLSWTPSDEQMALMNSACKSWIAKARLHLSKQACTLFRRFATPRRRFDRKPIASPSSINCTTTMCAPTMRIMMLCSMNLWWPSRYVARFGARHHTLVANCRSTGQQELVVRAVDAYGAADEQTVSVSVRRQSGPPSSLPSHPRQRR